MRRRTPIGACLLLAGVVLAGCGESKNENAPKAVAVLPVGQETAAARTPFDQSEDKDDLRIAADIRYALMHDESLSVGAQNCMVVAANGMVTLRGVVESQDEKDAVERIAKSVRGVKGVENQLDVKRGA